MKRINLETSSYLPLIWVTPYSQGILDLVSEYKKSTFYIQEDSIKEALSYFNIKRNWFRDPAVRLRLISGKLTDEEMKLLSFPSSAFQILLGGKIWPSGMYLNFVRHTAFLYADLIDNIDFSMDKRKGLFELAEKIDGRFNHLKKTMEMNSNSSHFEFSFENILSYWGRFYLSPNIPKKLKVFIWKDPEPFTKGPAKIRDLYHYESMIKSNIEFDTMVVANTGFAYHIKNNRKDLPVEIVCASSKQNDIYLS